MDISCHRFSLYPHHSSAIMLCLSIIVLSTLFSTLPARSQDLVAGNLVQLSPEDPHLLKAVAAVKPAIRKRYSKYTIDKVLNAQYQVVAGKKYFVTLQLVQLRRGSNNKPNKAGSPANRPSGPKRICQAEIVVVPWRHATELASFVCEGKSR